MSSGKDAFLSSLTHLLYSVCVTFSCRMPSTLAVRRDWIKSCETRTYSPKASLTLSVAPVVQLSKRGSMRGASDTLGWLVPRLVRNQAARPDLSRTPATRSRTVSKCGLPKKRVRWRDHESEWTTRRDTLSATLRGPLSLPGSRAMPATDGLGPLSEEEEEEEEEGACRRAWRAAVAPYEWPAVTRVSRSRREAKEPRDFGEPRVLGTEALASRNRRRRMVSKISASRKASWCRFMEGVSTGVRLVGEAIRSEARK